MYYTKQNMIDFCIDALAVTTTLSQHKDYLQVNITNVRTE